MRRRMDYSSGFVGFTKRRGRNPRRRRLLQRASSGDTEASQRGFGGASIASDNGRAAEFIRRKVYKDKSKCYECGDSGHLSYDCPKNQLGPREKPEPSKKWRRGADDRKAEKWEEGSDDEEENMGLEEENWASIVDQDAGERLLGRENDKDKVAMKGKRGKRKGYFSDESDEDD